jgi:hypothetical protein
MYNTAPEAGLASLLSSRGRNGDSVLVHMTPDELQGLKAIAMAHGGELTINPETGLYEANILKKFLPMIAGAVLNTVAPGIGGSIGKFLGLSGTAASTLGTGLLVGGVTGLIEGDLKKGLMAGIGAYSGANLAQALQGASVGAGIEPERVSAEELAKTNQAMEVAKQTVGATPVVNPTVASPTVDLATADLSKIGLDRPTIGFNTPSSVASTASLPMAQLAGQAAPADGLDFFKSANAFRAMPDTGGMPTALDLSTGRAANISGTGMRGVGEGITSLFKSPQARKTFIDRLGGGFESGLGQSAAKYATLMGVSDAFTPEYEMPSGDSGDDTVYVPGGFNPMYGYGREHGYFLPGKYYKRTSKGLVPYNPYAMAPGYAAGGSVQAPNQNGNQPMPYPHPNQNYPLSTVVKANYSPQYISNVPQPREVLSGYDTKVDPFTGEERFAEGGPVFGGQMIIPAVKDGVEGYYTDTTRTTFVPKTGVSQPPVGVAPPKGPPLAQPTNPLPPQPPVGPPPVILPPENPFDPARQRYMDMVNAPPKAPVDTKPTMDYLDELSRRARKPEFMVFPPGGYPITGGGGTGGGTGGDKGDKGDKGESGGGRGGAGTGTGGSGGGGGGITGGTGTGTGGTGTGTGGTGPGTGTGTGTGPKTGGGPPGTGKDEGDADENQDDVDDAEKEDDDGLLDKARGKFMEWFDKRFRDPYGLVGTAIGLTGAGMLGTWAWDKLTPNIKKFFATPEGLTEAQQLEIEEAVRAQLEEEKAKQEKAAKDKENEGRTSRRENRGGEGRGGAGIGGGAGGGFGGGLGGGRKGVITVEEDVLPARSGGRIRAMRAGGLPTPPNPYGAAVGEDYNFGFSGGGAMPTEYLAGGKLLEGPGDGMSDDIPAVIRGKGVQRAALADGEFVVPADVVSHLGNGSTKAGAKKLYTMMNRIRQARTGKSKQAPEVEADKYMPA